MLIEEDCETIGDGCGFIFFFSDKEEIKWRDLSKRVMFYFILSRDVM